MKKTWALQSELLIKQIWQRKTSRRVSWLCQIWVLLLSCQNKKKLKSPAHKILQKGLISIQKHQWKKSSFQKSLGRWVLMTLIL